MGRRWERYFAWMDGASVSICLQTGRTRWELLKELEQGRSVTRRNEGVKHGIDSKEFRQEGGLAFGCAEAFVFGVGFSELLFLGLASLVIFLLIRRYRQGKRVRLPTQQRVVPVYHVVPPSPPSPAGSAAISGNGADVFLSYVEEDVAVAVGIAAELERQGFQVWYYQRDALPGVSYLAQCYRAIEACGAVVLLCSVRSVGSKQVSKELVQAHELDRPILPILLEMSHEAFLAQAPREWKQALGAAATMNYHASSPSEAHSRIGRGLEALGVCRTGRPG